MARCACPSLFWLFCAVACACFPFSAKLGGVFGVSWEQHGKKESDLSSLSAKGSSSVHGGMQGSQVRLLLRAHEHRTARRGRGRRSGWRKLTRGGGRGRGVAGTTDSTFLYDGPPHERRGGFQTKEAINDAAEAQRVLLQASMQRMVLHAMGDAGGPDHQGGLLGGARPRRVRGEVPDRRGPHVLRVPRSHQKSECASSLPRS